MQLASLMPTPSASASAASAALLLQLKPPALPLENVSFQTMFGDRLQKQLDHYLTYVAPPSTGRPCRTHTHTTQERLTA